MFCDMHGSGPCLCNLEDNSIPNYIDYSYHDIDECEQYEDTNWESWVNFCDGEIVAWGKFSELTLD